jgi:hypothetical protein
MGTPGGCADVSATMVLGSTNEQVAISRADASEFSKIWNMEALTLFHIF